jgi:PrtD family type I secretion system ABC transporter
MPSNHFQETLRRMRSSLVAIGLFSFLINLLAIVTSLYMMLLFDRVMPSGSMPTLIWLTVIACVALLVMGLLDAIRTSTVNRLGAWFEARLGPDLIDLGLAAVPASFLPYEALMKIKHFVGGQAVYPLLDAPWMPLFIGLLFLMHPWFGWLAIVSALCLFALAWLNDRLTRRDTEAASSLMSRSRQVVETAFRNADVTRAMRMTAALSARWEQTNSGGLDLQVRIADISAIIAGLTKFLRLSIQIAILGLGVFLALKGEISAGSIIAASILLSKALQPVELAIASWKQLVGARQGYRQLAQIYAERQAASPKSPLPAAQGLVSLESVSWSPRPGGPAILKSIDLSCRPGEVVGIIGPSGSGKSTLCRLIAGGLQPSSGTLRLDGSDYALWPDDQFAAAIGYLPQEVELFPVSLASNIARLAAETDQEAVWDAAALAGIHDTILRLEKGYDTVLTSDGRSLSGGQRQRVGLARALYKWPKLIVLDEPNANLDQEGDQHLMQALTALRDMGSTVIFVSHRPSLLTRADRIVVMAEGTIALQGPAREVIAQLTGPLPADTARPVQAAPAEHNVTTLRDGNAAAGRGAKP